MPKSIRILLGWAILLIGAALALFGVWAILAYIWGVIGVLGEADKSWIFWGLAILFTGIFAIAGGVPMMYFGRRLIRGERARDEY